MAQTSTTPSCSWFRAWCGSAITPNGQTAGSDCRTPSQTGAVTSAVTWSMVSAWRDAASAVSENLRYVAAWNAAFLPSKDLTEGISATFAKRPPQFTGE